MIRVCIVRVESPIQLGSEFGIRFPIAFCRLGYRIHKDDLSSNDLPNYRYPNGLNPSRITPVNSGAARPNFAANSAAVGTKRTFIFDSWCRAISANL